MNCLPLALILGALAVWLFNPFIGLIVGMLAYLLCRFVRKQRCHQSDNPSSSSNSSNSNSSDNSMPWIGSGGLFGGASAAGNWDAADNSDEDSGGGGDGGGD